MTDPRAQTHPAPSGLPTHAGAVGQRRASWWSGPASPGSPPPPGWPNAVSRSTSSSANPTSAVGSADGPSTLPDGTEVDDESRLPRVLPPVLQPAKPVAPHRSGAGNADAGRRLPADRCAGAQGHVPGPAADAAVERDGVRAAQPHLPAARSGAAQRPRGRAAGCGVGTRHLSTASTTATPDSFLRDINFPEAARHLAFEVFSRSFFAEPSELSAAELAAMFHIYFLGSREGLIFDVANANFDVALWNPLARVSGIDRSPSPHRVPR